MPKVILVPQLRMRMRYSEWWWSEIESRLRNEFGRVITLGRPKVFDCGDIDFDMSVAAIRFELSQIDEFMNLRLTGDEILLLMDISLWTVSVDFIPQATEVCDGFLPCLGNEPVRYLRSYSAHQVADRTG